MQALFVECIQCLIDAASLAGVQSDKFPSSGVGEGGCPDGVSSGLVSHSSLIWFYL